MGTIGGEGVELVPGQGKIIKMGTVTKNQHGGWTVMDWVVDMTGADSGAAGIAIDGEQVIICGIPASELGYGGEHE